MVTLKRTVSLLIVAFFILLVAGAVILFARGYRFNLRTKSLKSQGIFVANSSPTSAQIYINDKFYGLTSNNIYLFPGRYIVTIRKEGYSPWQKTFTIKGEVVSRSDAQLFSTNPSLSPLSNRGVINPVLSPSKEQIAYLVLPEENELPDEDSGGLFVGSINSKTLGLFRSRTQLIPYRLLPVSFAVEKTKLLFSPDEKNLMVFLFDEFDNLLSVLLIATNNTKGEFFDVTLSYQSLLQKWAEQEAQLKDKILETFKKKIGLILSKQAYVIEISPDKSKILYLALAESKLPLVINPPLVGSVPTQEERSLKPGKLYVYDSKEDKNFVINLLSESEQTRILNIVNKLLQQEIIDLDYFVEKNALFSNIFWYNDSRHLIYQDADTISTVEYDGTNKTLVYSGPFQESFAAVTDDGKLVILTNINPKKNKLPDLYTVSIK